MWLQFFLNWRPIFKQLPIDEFFPLVKNPVYFYGFALIKFHIMHLQHLYKHKYNCSLLSIKMNTKFTPFSVVSQKTRVAGTLL